MIFNSFIFFVFLGVVLPVFYLLPNKTSKNVFLLIASYFFYGYWDWRFCSLLAFTTLVDYFIGNAIHRTEGEAKRKRLLIVSLVVNLGILGFFKYFNFFIDNIRDVSAGLGFKLDFIHMNIILPVGLSFYVFHNLSYIIDIYRRKIEPSQNIIDFGLFVTFFPQLVAGPIGRASALLPQLSRNLKPTRAQVYEAIPLIVSGLFRKVMIGDTTGRFVDHIFENMEAYKGIELLSALVLFSIQIYADFSGYTMVARGTSKLFGVELMKNFEQPYLSHNITEFWRRWHISLSSWLRDYLYISLGGNRKGQTRTYVNLMLTMLLGGLWHGASWNFVIWGGLHGLYLAVHKMYSKGRSIQAENVWPVSFRSALSMAGTYVLVLFTWLFFRSTSWETTRIFFSKMWHWETSEYTGWFVLTTLTYLVLIVAMDLVLYATRKETELDRILSVPLRYGVMAGTFFFTMMYLYQSKPMPFIYFKF